MGVIGVSGNDVPVGTSTTGGQSGTVEVVVVAGVPGSDVPVGTSPDGGVTGTVEPVVVVLVEAPTCIETTFEFAEYFEKVSLSERMWNGNVSPATPNEQIVEYEISIEVFSAVAPPTFPVAMPPPPRLPDQEIAYRSGRQPPDTGASQSRSIPEPVSVAVKLLGALIVSGNVFELCANTVPVV